jgi:hypothetical protein
MKAGEIVTGPLIGRSYEGAVILHRKITEVVGFEESVPVHALMIRGG